MLRELFNRNPNIIINNDIDGFLSGMILQKYYGCKVVGFSNSKDKVWIAPEVNSIYDPVYIDMYVNKPEVVCIDQHIVADTQERLNRILAYGTKFNPNLQLAQRTFESNFGYKYPFGTVHYLIKLMGDEGVEVELGDLTREVHVEINGVDYITNPGQLLLRADDALYNTLKAYKENSADWWRILNTCTSIQNIVDYIGVCERDKAVDYENNIGNILCKLGCKKNSHYKKELAGVVTDSDGAFDNITDSYISGTCGNLNPAVLPYIAKIKEIIGMELSVPNMYILHKAEISGRSKPEDNITADGLFSYAFVSGPGKRESAFSYTRNMR